MPSSAVIFTSAALLLSQAECAFYGPSATASHAAFAHRRPPAIILAECNSCALIDLTADEPIRVAQVLKKAWMEGGVKRGLKGSVLVPKDGLVQIVATGPPERLQSFAEWVETSSALVSKVELTELDACPVVPLSAKFDFADTDDEDSTVAVFKDLLDKASVDVSAAKGKRQSSDEGLA